MSTFNFALQNLISRNYRGDIDFGIIDKFLPLVLEREEEEATSPIIVHGDVTFVYIKYNNLYSILLFILYHFGYS